MRSEYRTLTDETLVSLTLLGENTAFETLVIKYQRAVTASAYSIVRNSSLAEDIMQDTFVGAWIKLDTLKEPNKFGAWVCRIAKNNARNMAVKYRDYISFDLLENIELEKSQNIADSLCQGSDEYDFLHMIIDSMSDKIKDVISMHYFDGAPIDEISTKLNLPVGTVKRRLHDGREKIRKELGYMENNEKTVAQSVIKAVEKVKNWYDTFERDGFEADYENAMKEIEKLPDSESKYFNMAEVMVRGYWWLPGQKNDEIAEKLKEIAQKGNNYDVIAVVMRRESDKYHGEEKISFILNNLIPAFEKGNMTAQLGEEWFWLGYQYFQNNKNEQGYDAFNRVLSILPKNDVYYANAISAIRGHKLTENCDKKSYYMCTTGERYTFENGKLRFTSQPGYTIGTMDNSPAVFYHASRCDGILYDTNMKVGESAEALHEKIKLTFVSDNAEIGTPAGKFDGCQLWITEALDFTSSVYYKYGVGIVYIELDKGGAKTHNALKKYSVIGGDGLVPLHAGNKWEYDAGYDPEFIDYEKIFEVIEASDSNAYVAAHSFTRRTLYSPDKWEDMMLQMRREYSNQKLRDISFPMERAAALADTEYKKTHTAVATDVMNRIFEGDQNFTPDGKYTGYWDFFAYHAVKIKEGKTVLELDRTYAFEWKGMSDSDAGYPLLGNDILGMLADPTRCIWDESWCDGFSEILKYNKYGSMTVTNLSVSGTDPVETPAGKFDNCIKITVDTKSDADEGYQYRMCKRDYCFAYGIGVVRCIYYFKGGDIIGDYQLTSYTGTGIGYMPVGNGLFRRYEAVNLTDGFVGKAEYTFINDDDGQLRLLENRTGIKMK